MVATLESKGSHKRRKYTKIWRHDTKGPLGYRKKNQPRVCVKIQSYTADMLATCEPGNKLRHTRPENMAVTTLDIIHHSLTIL